MAKANIIIRQATAADNVLLAEFGAKTFFDSFAEGNTPENMALYLAQSFSPSKQAAELREPGSRFLIAEIEAEAVGYARLKLGRPPARITGSRPVEIARFYARQDYIGQGVGPALMQACLAEADQMECETIWLDVWEKNSRAIAFYHKWGFKMVGTQAFSVGQDVQTDWLMQRPLTRRPRNDPRSKHE